MAFSGSAALTWDAAQREKVIVGTPETVTARLKEKYGVRDVVKREKGIAGAPSPDILAALTTCDFVLVGSAD